ncbi:MAG: hypothetical protein QOC82_568 [Frankiaceae bacterium]|jgi:hypothetical protein|nr:hypothetical protein [Frankiaceae bacterium]MDQ1698910.1 hypothetical protein [Frankiaceae bacterium]
MSDLPPYGGYQQPGGYPTPQQNGLGTAAMVLGIIGLVLFFTVFIGIVCGVLAIIFGIIGRNRARLGQASNHGQATAGLVTGIIAVVFSIGLILLVTQGHYCAHIGTGPDPCQEG